MGYNIVRTPRAKRMRAMAALSAQTSKRVRGRKRAWAKRTAIALAHKIKGAARRVVNSRRVKGTVLFAIGCIATISWNSGSVILGRSENDAFMDSLIAASIEATKGDTIEIDGECYFCHVKDEEVKQNSKKESYSKRWLHPDSAYVKLAYMMDSIHGVPAAITLAQGIKETGGGRKTSGKNNYWGHKRERFTDDGMEQGSFLGYDDCHDKNGKEIKCEFNQYKTRWWAFRHHTRKLLNQWAPHRKGDSMKEWADCLCSAKLYGKGKDYTNIGCNKGGDAAYNKQILRIIKDYKLERFNYKR